jgi:hypothetical protein
LYSNHYTLHGQIKGKPNTSIQHASKKAFTSSGETFTFEIDVTSYSDNPQYLLTGNSSYQTTLILLLNRHKIADRSEDSITLDVFANGGQKVYFMGSKYAHKGT